MDPYNNRLDFIKLVHPNRHISPTQEKMIEMIDAAHTPNYTVAMTGTAYPALQPAISLGTINECSTPEPKRGWGCKPIKKEENPMASYASAQIIADTTEKDQRGYVADRLRTIRYEKSAALEKQFGLIDEEAPKTPAAFVQRIADGMYTIDKERMDKQTYRPMDYIRWRDPSVVEDKEGYKAAIEKMEVAYRTAKDAAVLSPIADAKTAMDTFAAWSLS